MSNKKAITVTIAVLLVCLVVLLWIWVLQPPASFRRAMSAADRIEIESPKFTEYPSKIVYQREEVVVSGEEAKKAARSLQFLWCVGYPACLSEAQVRFYQGTNLLTEAGMCGEVLLINGKWYMPGTSGKSFMRSWSDRLRQTDPQQQKAIER